MRGLVLEHTAASRLPSSIVRAFRLRRPQVIQSLYVTMPADLLDALLDAAESGIIAKDIAAAITDRPLMMQGLSRDDGTPVYVPAEVSGALNHHDITRALEMAAALESATNRRTLAVVAAIAIPTPRQDQASAAAVTTYLLS